jgi:hypothetical protein
MKKTIIITAIITAVLVTAVFAGCEGLKQAFGQNETAPTAAPPATAVSTPAPAPAPKEPFRTWDKNKYFDMLHRGYKTPARAVTSSGYTGSGTTTTTGGKKRVISEKEGEGLKYKLGEGKKYARSGRGSDPKVPDFINNGDDR